jgi:hypothetical protein
MRSEALHKAESKLKWHPWFTERHKQEGGAPAAQPLSIGNAKSFEFRTGGAPMGRERQR